MLSSTPLYPAPTFSAPHPKRGSRATTRSVVIKVKYHNLCSAIFVRFIILLSGMLRSVAPSYAARPILQRQAKCITSSDAVLNNMPKMIAKQRNNIWGRKSPLFHPLPFPLLPLFLLGSSLHTSYTVPKILAPLLISAATASIDPIVQRLADHGAYEVVATPKCDLPSLRIHRMDGARRIRSFRRRTGVNGVQRTW
jgi:hypothetical protein